MAWTLTLTPSAGHAAFPEDVRWDSRFNRPPGIDGPVYSIATNGNEIYVGGNFDFAGHVAATNLARWDGTNWHPVGGGVNGTVYTLHYFGTNLYVGGAFSKGGTTALNNIGAWSGTRWIALGAGITAQNQNPLVITIANVGSQLYVGGAFRRAGQVDVKNIARWDGLKWNDVAGGIFIPSSNTNNLYGSVQAILPEGSTFIVGGVFSRAGNVVATNIVRWNGTAWTAYGNGLSAFPTSPYYAYTPDGGPHYGAVLALAKHDGKLFVAGDFDQNGTVYLRSLAYWAENHFEPVNFPGTERALVNSLESMADGLYVGGSYQKNGDFRNLLRFANNDWQILDAGIDGPIYTLKRSGNQLIVGGRFGTASDVSAGNVSLWNPQLWKWSPLGKPPGNTIVGLPYSIASRGKDVFVAGDFNSVAGERARHAAHFDGISWKALGTDLPGPVNQIEATTTDLFVSGLNLSASERGISNIARWSGTNWVGVGSLTDPDYPTNYIQCMDSEGANLYAVVNFTGRGNIRKWDGNTWSIIPSFVHRGSNAGYVTALLSVGTDIYMAGFFDQIGSVNATNIAKWNGTSWSPLGFGIANKGEGFFFHIRSLAWDGANLFAGGLFSGAGGTRATNFARWNGTNWSDMNNPFREGDVVQSMAVENGKLFVSGNFNRVGNIRATNIVMLDRNTWMPLGSGLTPGTLNTFVDDIASSDGKVFAIGGFTKAGENESYSFAIWNEVINPDGPISFTSASKTPGGDVRFTLQGSPGQSFDLQRSANLLDWETFLRTNFSGQLVEFDMTPGNDRREFYRTVKP